MTTMLDTLLDHLHRGGAFGYWWYLDEVQKDKYGNKRKRSVWWKVGRRSPCKPGPTEHAYFGVHPTTQIPATNAKGKPMPPHVVRSQIQYIAAINCLFAEFDSKDFGDDKAATLDHIESGFLKIGVPTPSVVIDSGGGYHAYWLLVDPLVLDTDENRARAHAVQRAWAAFVGADDVKDLARVLRAPGTRNVKERYAPDYPTVDFVSADFDLLYTFDELAALVPKSTEAKRESTGVAPHVAGGNAYAAKALANEIAAVVSAPDGQKHNQLLKSAASLGELVAGGVLERRRVEDALFAAIAPRAEDLENARKTIQDGLDYGAARPRGIPERRNGHGPHVDKTTGEILDDKPETHRPPPEWGDFEEEAPDDEEEVEPPLTVEEILKGLAETRSEGEEKANREAAEAYALDIVEDAGDLNKTEILAVARALRAAGVTSEFVKDWRAAVKEARQRKAEEHVRPAASVSRGGSWPYTIQKGRLVYLSQKTLISGDTVIESTPIADFEARIVEEVIVEDGTKLFVLEGKALRGGEFRTEIAAEEFSDDRKLKAALEAAAGARDPVRAGMTKHLGPAIKLLTASDLHQTRRYHRTGWAGDRFLIPGREPADVEIVLHQTLPYRIEPEADLTLGLEALQALVESRPPERTTIILAAVLTAPMAYLAGWRNERYGVFSAGRTGSWKTTVNQLMMAIYGRQFVDDAMIAKFGLGSTHNARMALASQAHDLPFLVDNYKPNTGRGVEDLLNFLHAVLEGREKDRMTRSSELRESRTLLCWPLITGEDVPDTESSTMARVLAVQFDRPTPGEENPKLTRAQELSEHLCAVGGAWLDWLETEEGRRVAAELGSRLPERRTRWGKKLAAIRSDIQNSMRVATNLATNELAWEIICHHPAIGPIARRYSEAHAAGLEATAESMARYTAEALEATQYLAALRELLASRAAILLPADKSEYRQVTQDGRTVVINREDPRMIGWQDADGDAYLLPLKTLEAVNKLLGENKIRVGNVTLYKQLDELGALASKSGDRGTVTKRLGGEGKIERVLHIARSAIYEDEGGADDTGGHDIDTIPF